MDGWQKTVYEKMRGFAESRIIQCYDDDTPTTPVLMNISQEEAYVIMKAMEKAYIEGAQ